MNDQDRATTDTENANLPTEPQGDGDARQPGDMLERNQTNPDVGVDFVASGTRRPRGRF